jgi:hypothetical protein
MSSLLHDEPAEGDILSDVSGDSIYRAITLPIDIRIEFEKVGAHRKPESVIFPLQSLLSGGFDQDDGPELFETSGAINHGRHRNCHMSI